MMNQTKDMNIEVRERKRAKDTTTNQHDVIEP